MTHSNPVSTLLICAITGERLALLDESGLAHLNRQLLAGAVRTRCAESAPTSLEGGLLAPRSGLVYPIVDDLPRLLPEDALETAR